MILPPKWSINMGPGVDMRGLLCRPTHPRRLRPRVLFANESRGRKVQSGRVLIYPIFTCSCVCASGLSRLRPVGSALPHLGLRIICHVVPSDSLELSPPTLLTRAVLLSLSDLWLLKAGAGYPLPLPLPSLRGSKTEYRLSNRPRCPCPRPVTGLRRRKKPCFASRRRW